MTDKPTVVELLLKVMADVQAIGKDSRNREQNYNFRGIDAVVNAVGPRLREHGVLPVPVLLDASYRDVLTTKEKRSRECTVKVAYRFYGPGGDFVEAVVPGESLDFSDKGAAKAMSVAYRIALLQALCIPTDEPDTDAHHYERAQEPPTPDPQQIRQNLLARAAAAIRDASLKEDCDRIGQRITEHEKAQRITAQDAIDLRRQLVARLEELFPTGEVVPVTERQHKRMHALWREVGLAGTEHRETRLTRTSLIVGHDIDSSAHLTAVEADKVIDVLEAERKRAQEPPQAEPEEAK